MCGHIAPQDYIRKSIYLFRNKSSVFLFVSIFLKKRRHDVSMRQFGSNLLNYLCRLHCYFWSLHLIKKEEVTCVILKRKRWWSVQSPVIVFDNMWTRMDTVKMTLLNRNTNHHKNVTLYASLKKKNLILKWCISYRVTYTKKITIFFTPSPSVLFFLVKQKCCISWLIRCTHLILSLFCGASISHIWIPFTSHTHTHLSSGKARRKKKRNKKIIKWPHL